MLVRTLTRLLLSVQLDSMNEIHRVKRLLPGVIDMLESDNDTVRNTGSFQVQTITRSGSVGEQYMVRLIQIYLETELDGILCKFVGLSVHVCVCVFCVHSMRLRRLVVSKLLGLIIERKN